MNASEFIRQVSAKGKNVSFEKQGKTFVVRGQESLPTYLRLAIAGHHDQLQEFVVDRYDVEIKVERHDENLRQLGFTLVPELKRWVHTFGDEVGEQILAGLLDPAEVQREQARADAEMDAYVTNRARAIQ